MIRTKLERPKQSFGEVRAQAEPEHEGCAGGIAPGMSSSPLDVTRTAS